MSDVSDDNVSLDAESLLARLEKQLDDMETSEILNDMTPEALAEKGFIGDKLINIGHSRSAKVEATEKEHLLFEQGVEYERLADNTVFEVVKLESLIHIRDVEKDQLIATRSADERTSFDAAYNVTSTTGEGVVRFVAKLRGKPIIIKDTLSVVPSDVDSRLQVRLDQSKMHAYMDCTPARGNGKPLTGDRVRIELAQIGVKHGIDIEGIIAAIDAANKTFLPITNFQIAAGTPPIAAQSGVIDYSFDLKPKEYDFTILPDGSIDYRNSKTILMATEGQLLAAIGPIIPGIPGKTIMGDSIPVESSVPATLIAGNGVRVSDTGKEFYAEIAGCIVLNGSVIEVVNIYVVNGDVDYSTGNINFNGNVIVSGTVLDGFEVKAEGDIIVSKLVESAKLTAGRDVIVKGGVLGRGKGLISAGRDIRIGYAQNAKLEAQGNIYIENYAVNSSIATSKRLIMLEKRGTVLGGEVFALNGIDVKSLGSENGTKTSVEAGTDFLAIRTLAEMEEVISFCKQNIRKLDDVLLPISGKVNSAAPIRPEMKTLLLKALEKKKELNRRMATISAKRSDLQRLSLDRETCFVKVLETCYPDVSIKIKDLKTIIMKSRSHVRFFDDRKAGEIGSGSY